MVNFLLDPKGDLPWEEDVSAQDVVHLDSEGVRLFLLILSVYFGLF